jgi:hypothetical protein
VQGKRRRFMVNAGALQDGLQIVGGNALLGDPNQQIGNPGLGVGDRLGFALAVGDIHEQAAIEFGFGNVYTIPLYISFGAARRAYSDGEVHNPLESLPEAFRSRLTIALATEESAEARDQPDRVVELRRLWGQWLAGDEPSRLPLFPLEHDLTVDLQAGSTQPHQVADPPSNDHEQGQGQFDPGHRRQLQGFDLAAVLENVEKHLDIPLKIPL